MSSSKVILIGAVSVVFGLYSLSLNKVGTYVGGTAEITFYIAKAEENAKSGIQRALNLASRNWGFPSLFGGYTGAETFNLTDPDSKSEGYFTYSVTFNKSLVSGSTGYVMTVVSRGVYKAPAEPSAFTGHEVARTATAIFDYIDKDLSSGVWLDVKLQSAYTTVNYTRERQLDSLQTLKGN